MRWETIAEKPFGQEKRPFDLLPAAPAMAGSANLRLLF
jgi:hypothetical protein